MERFDMLSDSSGLLRIEGSDLVFGASDTQHVQDTINAAPGWYKENFSDGVNVRLYLNSLGMQQILSRSIKLQLESDLYIVDNPTVKYDQNGKLVINPNATI